MMPNRYCNIFRISLVDADLLSGVIAGVAVSSIGTSFGGLPASIAFSFLPGAIVSSIFLGGRTNESEYNNIESIFLKIVLIGFMTLIISFIGALIGTIPIEIMGISDTRAKAFFWGMGAVSTLLFLPFIKMQDPDMVYRVDTLSKTRTTGGVEDEESAKNPSSLELRRARVSSKTRTSEAGISSSELSLDNNCHQTARHKCSITSELNISSIREIIRNFEEGNYTECEIRKIIEEAPYLGLEREDVEKIYRYLNR